jgi:FdhE protein
MALSQEDIASKVKAIGKRNPAYAEVIQWAGELLSETVRASGKFRPPSLNLEQESSPEAWLQGRSLLDPGELSLDWEQARALYKRLVGLVETRESARRQVEGLLQALVEDQEGASGLLKAALTSDLKAIETAAQPLEIDPPVLTLLLRLSLRPALLDVARAALDRLDLSQWNYGHCPVCGSAPILADLSPPSLPLLRK